LSTSPTISPNVSALQSARTLAVLPARYGAQRFPGKPLADLAGKPVIQHVYERTLKARGLDAAIVATDDARIFDAVVAFGGAAMMTSPSHATGTERTAEVARYLSRAELVLNVQGDEPFVEPASIEALLAALTPTTVSADDRARGRTPARFATLAEPLRDGDLANKNVVKVVTTRGGHALYFSRSPIPSDRGPFPATAARRHVGLYGFRRDALLWYATQSPTPLELAESLEQLRILELGERILVAEAAPSAGIAIDTPEDLERAHAYIASHSGAGVA